MADQYIHDGAVTLNARPTPAGGPGQPAAVAVYVDDVTTGRSILVTITPAAALALAVQLGVAAQAAEQANEIQDTADIAQVAAYLALSLPLRAGNTDPALGDTIRRVDSRRATQDRRGGDRRHVA